MKKYNSEKGVDVFKDAISVPGIARKLLFETSENNNTPCTPKALSPGVERQILGVKISARVIRGVHTASDSTRRSRYKTLWFRTCANI